MWGLTLCWWRWRGPDRQPQRSSPHVCPENPGEAQVVISLPSRRAAPGETGLGAKHGRVALHFRKGQALSGPRALSVRLVTPGLGTEAPSLLPRLPPPRRAPVTRGKSRTAKAPKPAPRKAAAARPVRIGQLAEVGRAQDGTAAGDLTCQPTRCFVGGVTGSAFPALLPEKDGGQAGESRFPLQFCQIVPCPPFASFLAAPCGSGMDPHSSICPQPPVSTWRIVFRLSGTFWVGEVPAPRFRLRDPYSPPPGRFGKQNRN
ncbi:hypothetical protein H8959_000016 [Pygathrix nigripes]